MRTKIEFETLEKIYNEIGEYDLGQTSGTENSIYLRFGYWKRVDVNKLQEILGLSINVIEDKDFDDDCGWQYSYKLK